MNSEKDPRFRFLMKNGQNQKILQNGNILIAELPNLPGTQICYRRPNARSLSPDMFEFELD